MLIFIILLLFVAWKIYKFVYYRSDKFTSIKERIAYHIFSCNELNAHIEDLKDTFLEFEQVDYGRSTYTDQSNWNYKRPALKTRNTRPTFKIAHDLFATMPANSLSSMYASISI